MQLSIDIYEVSKVFPKNEEYGLTSQLRRSATSIALNIAEGSGAGSEAEFCRFLSIATRSAYEVMCAIEIANRLSYCHDDQASQLLRECNEISAMLSGLRKRIINKNAVNISKNRQLLADS